MKKKGMSRERGGSVVGNQRLEERTISNEGCVKAHMKAYFLTTQLKT